MWKRRSNLILSFILFIAVTVIVQMGFYLAHLWFNWEIQLNLFQYCINVMTESIGGHLSIGLILNLWIGYTVLFVCWRVMKQIVLKYRFERNLKGLYDPSLSTEFNQVYCPLKRDIVVIHSTRPLAFTSGFFKRRIILSTGLLDMLDEREVEAVILHETYHLKHFDPLKVFMVTLISDVMWYIPVTKSLVHSYKTLRELLADQYAIQRMGSYFELGSALLKLTKNGWSNQQLTVVSFADTTINYRIKQLLEPNGSETIMKVKMKPLMISITMLFILMSVVLGGCA